MSKQPFAKGVRLHAREATTRRPAEEGSRSGAESPDGREAAYRAEARARRLRDIIK